MSLSSLIADMALLCAMGEDYQDNRLMRIDFPRKDGPKGVVMLVNTLKAKEEISRGFRFEAELLSNDARIPLKPMMGRMVTISLVRNDGSMRHFNGYVTEFSLLRADGGFACYNMVLEPWLSFARLRQDSVCFHGQSVLEITETTFQRYPQRDWKTILFDDYPRLTCANQYNETDYNHLHRRWEGAGLHYWYEHRADGHTLFLGDHSTLGEPVDATCGADDPQALHFRAESGSLEDDSVRHWRAVRRLGSGAMTLASFDYKNPRVQLGMGHSLNRQGDVARHEVYENAGAYAYKGPDDGDALAQRRMEERDHLTQYFEAGGNHRAVQPRRSFRLAGHFSATPKQPARGEETRPSIAPRKYLILSVEHTASNNYQAGPGAKSHYENSFVCVRKSIRWRPGRHYHSAPCPDPGPLTAIVVGPPGEDIHTDSLGRVKIQFHWDRLGQFNEFSSPWIRVMTPIAGQRHGQIGLPRVRQEVAVHFLGGDIDRPIITGPAYNGRSMPPWNLPDQRALTGLRSRERGGGERGNHLVLDDTRGAIQAQLRSDHQHSQLSLGAITRIEDTAGRKDARGEGFELASDAWGVLRAGRGMLITTEARPNAASHIKDMGETVGRLTAARDLHEIQADLARQSGAQEKQGQQAEVAASIKTQNDAIKGAGGGDFPELSAPHLVLASPAGIEATSAQSIHIASDEHTAITTGKSLKNVAMCMLSVFNSLTGKDHSMKKLIPLFLTLALNACATPEQKQAEVERAARIQKLLDNVVPETYVSISCVGHADTPVTGYSIQDLESTEEYGGGSCGGTNAAGYPLPKKWRPGMKVTVRWKLDRQPWRETATNIMPYDKANMLFVHIYNNNQVRVVSSNTYPGGAGHPISFNSKIPPPEEL